MTQFSKNTRTVDKCSLYCLTTLIHYWGENWLRYQTSYYPLSSQTRIALSRVAEGAFVGFTWAGCEETITPLKITSAFSPHCEVNKLVLIRMRLVALCSILFGEHQLIIADGGGRRRTFCLSSFSVFTVLASAVVKQKHYFSLKTRQGKSQ